MLENILTIEECAILARQRGRDYITDTCHPADVTDRENAGWTVRRRSKTSVQIQKKKPHNTLLEDQMWTLLYKMGFSLLSGKGGARLKLNADDPDSPENQIDVVAIDSEIALAVECKSQAEEGKRASFQEDLAKFANHRPALTRAIKKQYGQDTNRHVVLVMMLHNVILSDEDKKRAKELQVVCLASSDLTYYENLVSHIGEAARYQFSAEILPGKSINGLEISVPAIRTKVRGVDCYTFSIRPDYLLKIAYVAHRQHGRSSSIGQISYQRMLIKNRLKSIRQYISDGGVFPTNIVINLEKDDHSGYLNFDFISQENTENGRLGILRLKPRYKSAWIIDGQHRLFGYSGHPKASSSFLSILAFDGLPPNEQAELFIDINGKQKSVPRGLLDELVADLFWDSDKPSVRAEAVASKAFQKMDEDFDSPFYGRIMKADGSKDHKRCITINTVCKALQRQGFFIIKEKKGHVLEYGPLWHYDDTMESTLKRTVFILNNWFNNIREYVPDWWSLGSAPGGGLAMNGGVTVCINVLRSVLQHLESGRHHLRGDNDKALWQKLSDYSEYLGIYLSSLNDDDREKLRSMRGGSGEAMVTKQCQRALHAAFQDFMPEGLKDFIEQESLQTSQRANDLIKDIEYQLRVLVVQELRLEFGDDDNEWWKSGIPVTVRKKAMTRYEDDSGSRGSREAYFDIEDYVKIAKGNWRVLQDILGFGSGNQIKRLEWLKDLNESKKLVANTSASVPIDVVSRLEGYYHTLLERAKPDDAFEEE